MAAAMRSTGLLRLGFRQVSTLLFHGPPCPAPRLGLSLGVGRAGLVRLRCSAAAGDDGGKKVSARLALTQQVLRDAEERAASAGSDPAPKITLDHVTVNFARSGGPGGQNVNKVNTKVDMRFNVKEAHWLGERIKERILQREKNRINKDGELVISSTKTRTQKGNIGDALQKIQAIIDSASYVPPPPTEDQKKKIENFTSWMAFCLVVGPVSFSWRLRFPPVGDLRSFVNVLMSRYLVGSECLCFLNSCNFVA